MITNTEHTGANGQPGCSQDKACGGQVTDMHVGSEYAATFIAWAAREVTEKTGTTGPVEAI